MNAKRRERLRTAIKHLSAARDIVEDVNEEERDALQNVPENLQDTDRYHAMEDAVDALDSAVESISEAEESIESVVE